MSYDYVIVGAGAAGCVLAYRLSEDPRIVVCVIEAGPRDTHPFISMPKGLAKVMADPKHLWAYASEPDACTGEQSEMWVRGRVLGGSTSTNGMMYVRGQPADFDAIADVSSDDWSWKHIGAAYAALEGHELGAAETRGDAGPLKVTMPTLRDELSEAQIAAGVAMGWPRKDDVNAPDNGDGIGFTPRTIAGGKRQSAATAFLRPAEKRANLTVMTDCTVDRVTFTGKRATGVEVVRDGRRETVAARGEVIVCGGAMASPGVLERSGIGDEGRLKALGIPLIHHNPEVGEGLIEHRGLIVQWKVRRDISQNKQFHGWRLLRSAVQYYLTRSGPMAAAAYEIGGWFRTRPGLNRPDAQMLVAPFSFDFAKQRQDVERFPGMHVVVYPLRPTSRGSIHITTRDPDAAASFRPNYRANDEDRAAMIGAIRVVRDYVRRSPLGELVGEETMPGAQYETDQQILDAYDRFGTCGYHAVGSCRMGNDAASVVDPQLRVRGVDGLRIMDTSIMPAIPAGNTQGPTMAMAWRAADLILRDHVATPA
ncbi:glucose-methanol-choline oxidoreductase [Sphingomonas ginsenosidimutans]|jgi:choline dehydrogenase-like flavoprotein|uniref:Glucose-methanol-choline oxidoreductase n=2 Tax=Sphingomonadaceae TaxID=41297 RepID=A0A2A4HX45_9SPHN|nr:GMC family oxidoreductase N-terminal domain-containing protein [Sphingomonas ginsenosidimutans]MEE2916777.1 GMC family oxidoreductase N-terminal domain-containing protein [Pseudomonadota bacterium]PCG08469.1 glucose-methanol-choline oxidoreductase [Sphingomonas ginsenosidimutans]